jgi:hypothetical protein
VATTVAAQLTPDKSDNRTSSEPGLSLLGKRVNRTKSILPSNAVIGKAKPWQFGRAALPSSAFRDLRIGSTGNTSTSRWGLCYD